MTILCVSDSLNFRSVAYICDNDNNELKSGQRMKLLGFHFDRRPTCHAHVDALRKRMRERTWVLWHLKHAGFTQKELSTAYRQVIRPVLDYCCVIYHSLLTDEQDQLVERLQAQALKCIFGYKMSYKEMRARAEVTTLRERRIELADKFAEKAASNPRFARWFPLRVSGRSEGRRTVTDTYQEFQARTDRRMMSPLFYYRRRLNGKPGKSYGERNRIYRD